MMGVTPIPPDRHIRRPRRTAFEPHDFVALSRTVRRKPATSSNNSTTSGFTFAAVTKFRQGI
jgi:hypothetical protein